MYNLIGNHSTCIFEKTTKTATQMHIPYNPIIHDFNTTSPFNDDSPLCCL